MISYPQHSFSDACSNSEPTTVRYETLAFVCRIGPGWTSYFTKPSGNPEVKAVTQAGWFLSLPSFPSVPFVLPGLIQNSQASVSFPSKPRSESQKLAFWEGKKGNELVAGPSMSL